MKTQYKYIYFEVLEEKPKTKVWGCFNNTSHAILGHVKWFGPWRQYVFLISTISMYSKRCMDDISHFIDQLK